MSSYPPPRTPCIVRKRGDDWEVDDDGSLQYKGPSEKTAREVAAYLDKHGGIENAVLQEEIDDTMKAWKDDESDRRFRRNRNPSVREKYDSRGGYVVRKHPPYSRWDEQPYPDLVKSGLTRGEAVELARSASKGGVPHVAGRPEREERGTFLADQHYFKDGQVDHPGQSNPSNFQGRLTEQGAKPSYYTVEASKKPGYAAAVRTPYGSLEHFKTSKEAHEYAELMMRTDSNPSGPLRLGAAMVVGGLIAYGLWEKRSG